MKSTEFRILIGFVIITGTFVIILLGSILRYRTKYNGLSDAFLHTLFLYEDTTIYSSGFSEEAFGSLTVGTERKQVLALLGEPITKEYHTGNVSKEIWRYTCGATADRNYWFRTVVFDQHGRVKRIGRKYFVD